MNTTKFAPMPSWTTCRSSNPVTCMAARVARARPLIGVTGPPEPTCVYRADSLRPLPRAPGSWATDPKRSGPGPSSLEAVADYVQQLTGDLDHFIAYLDHSIRRSSATATYGGGIDQTIGDARQVVRVYERYSAFGGNRLRLHH